MLRLVQLITSVFIIASCTTTSTNQKAEVKEPVVKKGKVLIVLSSQDHVTLLKSRKGSKTVVHPTGFFLSELMVPAKALLDANYQLEFANPAGNPPVMDKISDSAQWFGKNDEQYKKTRKLCEDMKVCAPGALVGTLTPLKLSDVAASLAEKGDQYVGVFVPGGHAPLEDLWKDKDLGKILFYFHAKQKPTALICHGPVALLSTLGDPGKFATAVKTNNKKALKTLVKDWPYKGYLMTSFSTAEEKQEEPGSDNALGGYVTFYPDNALKNAGGKVEVVAKWQPNIRADRELITGQNPFSDQELAAKLVAALGGEKK